MSDRIKHPTQVYSFGDFSQRTPNQQPPGDRLDAQFSDHAQVLNEVIVALNNDEARLVRKDDLAPELIDSLTREVLLRTGVDAQAAAGAAMTSIHSAATALEAAIQSEASACKARTDAEVVRNGQGSVLSALEQLGAVATGHTLTLQNAKQTVDNSANDAAKASAIAQDYAVLSQAWAENMPDTIPPNILATMDITGSHWSSRWWANQADGSAGAAEDWAQQAQDAADAANAALDSFTDLYLGPKPANPTLDNDGNPLQVGAVYYNTSDGNMYVWTGTIWQVSSSAKGWVPEAPTDHISYNRKDAAWVAAAGGVADAPNDGKAYARKSTAWSQLNSNDVVFDTGPTTVTGAVNLKADQTALTAETAARISGDQASIAAVNNVKASGVANDSSVSGATVKDALNTNLSAINANASAITATNTALTLKANIASPVFTGDPQAPTPPLNDNDTSIPNTSWVNTAVSNAIASKSSIVVAAAPPGSPIDNGLWWESDTGYLFLRYNDGNSAQWVQVNGIPTALQANYVAKAGDTMTGPLLLAADPVLPLGAATKQYSDTKQPLAGVTDGSNALPGQIGEVISSLITGGASVALTTGVNVNVTSIVLSAGDWDVTGQVFISPTAVATSAHAGLGPVSATIAGAPSLTTAQNGFNTTFQPGFIFLPLRAARVNITVPTTYYLVGFLVFASGTATANGDIIARRVR